MNKGRFERKYDCNDSYFEEKSFQSIYWAGFLAADGHIPKSGHSISLSVSDKDESHLYSFISDIKTNAPLYKAKKGKYVQWVLRFSSKRNRLFLIENYNIVNNKSLILDKPKIHLEDEIDLYIKGYIDGDGSIFLTNNVLTISIIGTKEFLIWIQKRFQELTGKRIADPRPKRKNNKNTYILSICSKNARRIFLHYYNIECKCLERKWKKDYYIHCLEFEKNYSKSRILHLIPEFIRYYKKDYSGMSSKRKSYIKYSKGYNLFLALLDAGEVSLEDDNIVDQEEISMHDIIVRFPSKEMADYFCGQMSDGFGEGFCDFTKLISEDEKQVYSVEWVEDFDDGKDFLDEEE